MDRMLEKIFCKYNYFSDYGCNIKNNKTALRILKEEKIHNSNELDEQIRNYDNEEFSKNRNLDYQKLKSLFNYEQPKSISMRLVCIDIVINALENNFFVQLHLERNKLWKIVLSITLYILTLQTYTVSKMPMSKTAEKWLLHRDDFWLGLTELKAVCWDIQQEDFEVFSNTFAFDIVNRSLDEFNNEKLYKKNELIFILSIEEFLEYILLRIESLYHNNCTESDFSRYQHRKGFRFEKSVYQFMQPHYNKIAHSIYYYPTSDKEAEIDILLQEENYLIIIECKSGTIELNTAANDDEIKQKIENKVKKAYKTLDNASKYVTSNDEYIFKNDEVIISGKSSDLEVLCIHISMYPIDSISSNIHTIDQKYIGESNNPKITISFEHFIAICFDCQKRGKSIGSYFKRRKDLILKLPKAMLDVNELDLYYQIMNEKQSALMSELQENGINEMFNPDIQIITTFHNSLGEETRPSTSMLKELDSGSLHNILMYGKSDFGLNKRYIINMKEYLTMQ